jgi:hypothetical protein
MGRFFAERRAAKRCDHPSIMSVAAGTVNSCRDFRSSRANRGKLDQGTSKIESGTSIEYAIQPRE